MKQNSTAEQHLPELIRVGSVCLGGGSLILFFSFLILGTKLSLNLEISVYKAISIDIFLSFLFFAQHSTMVRPWFKERLGKIIPDSFYAAAYSIVSGLTLCMVVLFWQGTGEIIPVPGWLRIIQVCLVMASLAGFFWGVKSLYSFDPLGLRPQKVDAGMGVTLKIRGPFRYVRHPLYFFSLLLIWSTIYFSWDRVLFAVMWSAWIVIGAWMEEKDLVAFFGKPYQEYQKNVPMLVPKIKGYR